MKRHAVSALCGALSLAWLVPLGCTSPERREESTASVAQANTITSTFCAQGTGATKPSCVPDSQPPVNAWKQAVAAGAKQPIQMWVPYPDGNLDTFVANRAELDAWFADVKTLTNFLGSASANAESFDASLKGTLGKLMSDAKAEQDKLVTGAPVDPSVAIKGFENALVDAGGASQLDAAIVFDKQAGATVTTIVQAAQQVVTGFQQPFAALVTRFNAYRATEGDEMFAYNQYAWRGTISTLDSMPPLEDEIVSFNRNQSPTPDQFIIDATQLRVTIAAEGRTYAAQLEPYADVMSRLGMKSPDLTSMAVRSLDNMLAYVDQRRQRNDAVAVRLLDELAQRRRALILLQADQATQAAVAQREVLASSTGFLNDATAKITALWAAPTTSARLKLPYLAARYDSFTAFLQLAPLCGTAVAGTWREAGCNSLNPQFNKARSYLQTTLPGQLKIGAMMLSGSPGVTAAMLADIQTKLTAGDVRGAAAEYDAALAASDG